MADKLSWNPPKWKSYTLNGSRFEVELETGEVYKGIVAGAFIEMEPVHSKTCSKIFGQSFITEHKKDLEELSKALDLSLGFGNWPESTNMTEFLKRYYERVAKIGNSNISKIYIETEFDVTPKFTI